MKTKYAIILFLVVINFSSCVVSREQMGNYNSIEGKSKTIRVDQEINLFWDMVPLQKVATKNGLKDYEIIKRRNLFNTITYYGTVGIFSSYKVTIKTKQADIKKVIPKDITPSK